MRRHPKPEAAHALARRRAERALLLYHIEGSLPKPSCGSSPSDAYGAAGEEALLRLRVMSYLSEKIYNAVYALCMRGRHWTAYPDVVLGIATLVDSKAQLPGSAPEHATKLLDLLRKHASAGPQIAEILTLIDRDENDRHDFLHHLWELMWVLDAQD